MMDPDTAASFQLLAIALILVAAIGIVRTIANALEDHFHD